MGALSDFVQQMKDVVMDSSFMDFQQGLGTLEAHGRGGLKDLQDVVVHAFPDSQHQHEALGMIGSPTPQMVHESLTGAESAAKNIDMDMDK